MGLNYHLPFSLKINKVHTNPDVLQVETEWKQVQSFHLFVPPRLPQTKLQSRVSVSLFLDEKFLKLYITVPLISIVKTDLFGWVIFVFITRNYYICPIWTGINFDSCSRLLKLNMCGETVNLAPLWSLNRLLTQLRPTEFNIQTS